MFRFIPRFLDLSSYIPSIRSVTTGTVVRPNPEMQALVVSQYGGPEVFQPSRIKTPEVKRGHVLIEVKASSVNPVDYKIRKGMSPALSPELPAILHGDVAGVVVDLGEDVSRFKLGDEVYGCAGGFKNNGGALAEYMLADARLLALKPRSLSMVESAALPLVAITAYEALFDRAHLKPGQTVLIQGAAGGVGHVAVQLAKACGAKVYATASSKQKLEIAEEFGAIAINYKEKTPEEYVREYTGGKGFDVVMNTAGGPSLQDALFACALNGTIAGISSSSTYDLAPMHRKGLSLHIVLMPNPLVHNIGRERHGEILEEVTRLVDKGLVKPLIDRVFPFSQVGESHQYLESGQAVGKVGLEQDLRARL